MMLASNKGALIGFPGGGKAHLGRGGKMDGRLVQREKSEEAVQQRGGRVVGGIEGAGWDPGRGALL